MAEGHQCRSGVGHGRESGLADEAHVAFVEEAGKGLNFLRLRVLVERVELQFFNVALQSGSGQETARRAYFLHHKAIEPERRLQHGSRQHVGRIVFAQRRRNQI